MEAENNFGMGLRIVTIVYFTQILNNPLTIYLTYHDEDLHTLCQVYRKVYRTPFIKKEGIATED